MKGAVTVAKMEPRGSSVSPLRTRKRGRTLRPRKTTLGSRSGRSNTWAECREKKIGIEPRGSTFLLTFPLIGHCYIALKTCHNISGVAVPQLYVVAARGTRFESDRGGDDEGRGFCFGFPDSFRGRAAALAAMQEFVSQFVRQRRKLFRRRLAGEKRNS